MTSTPLTTPWLPADPSTPGHRLFCLPYAGGSASVYAAWIPLLAPDIAVVPVELPGRGTRRAEPPESDPDRLVARLADALRSWTDRPYALLGHSLGAILAFELARRVRPAPGRLFVAGSVPPPDAARPARTLHRLPDSEFLAALRAMGIGPSRATLVPTLLSSLRADVQAAETYRYRAGRPVTCPISVLGGRSDRMVDPSRLPLWSAHTSADADIRLFPGGHFFPWTLGNLVLRAIRRDMSDIVATRSAR